MNRSSLFTRLALYAILILGSLAFAFPFIWMVSTSLKLDKELFRGQIDIMPEQPNPRAKSPYYDARQYEYVELQQPQFSTLAPLLNDRVAAASLPPGANTQEVPDLIVAGLFENLHKRAPASIWNGDPATLVRYATAEVTPARIGEVAQNAYRGLGIGSLRARNADLQEQELATSAAPAQRWQNATPDVATLTNSADNSLPFAAVAYDFSDRDRFVLQNTFDLPFSAADVHRLQLRVRPDDTWHELAFTLESAGVQYAAARPVSLADTRWMTVTWQKPGADDHSTKIKTWIVMNPVAAGPQFDHGANRIRVTLAFQKLTPMQAGFSKARYNFQRVLDQIPFWRYVRVSILLVILNVVLTLFSSSLVAYAFARLQWPGRDIAFLVMLGTMMIPGQVTMIPHFLIWKTVGAYNTLTPLFAGAAFGNAFFIFLMRQFLKGIPPDLEDAARIDGCGFLRIYWHVMLPLVKPSLAAIAIFTFMGTWNDFLGPLVYIADQRLYPLAFGLYAFSVQVSSNPVLTMAASLLMTVPVILVFFLTQRYFVQGITLTGMKG